MDSNGPEPLSWQISMCFAVYRGLYVSKSTGKTRVLRSKDRASHCPHWTVLRFPVTPDVAVLPADSLLSPNQGHGPTLGLTDYYFPRLMVTQGSAG